MPDPFEHRCTRAIERMVEHAPSTGGLALRIAHAELAAPHAGPATAPVSTDGDTLFYSPAFEALPLAAQAGWIAHATLHAALRHPQRLQALRARLGDVDAVLFGVCADAIVDGCLADAPWMTPRDGAVRLDRLLEVALGLEVALEAALLDWDVERLYRAVDDRRRGPASDSRAGARQRASRRAGGSGRDGRGEDAGRGDGTGDGRGAAPVGHREPGTREDHRDRGGRCPQPGSGVGPVDRADLGAGPWIDGPRAGRVRALAGDGGDDLLAPGGSRAPEDEVAHARDWADRLCAAHAGDGPFSILRTLGADLPRSRVPWEQVLRVRLARALSRRADVCWSRPSRSWLANARRARRAPWEPAVLPGRAVPRVAVVVDVSGSVDAALLDRFALEVEAIVRRLEAGVVLVVGDERVRRVEAFEPGRSRLRGLALDGGGGTDFTPLLEEAARHRPDVAVVLTDLDGPARFRPSCPVIWAVPAARRAARAPFGTTLALD